MILKFKTAYELDFGFTSEKNCERVEFYYFTAFKGERIHLTASEHGFDIDNFEEISQLRESEYQNPFVERWIINGLINQGYVEKIAP